MRMLLLCVLVFFLCSGQTCIDGIPATDGGDDEQVSAGGANTDGEPDAGDDEADGDQADDPDEGPPGSDAKPCYTGTFECTDGPTSTPCGTWQFQVSDSDAIIGTGRITAGFDSAPIDVTLSGIADPKPTSFAVVLTSSDDGSGQMDLSYAEPTLNLTGTWTFTDRPGPTGTTATGTASASPCDGTD